MGQKGFSFGSCSPLQGPCDLSLGLKTQLGAMEQMRWSNETMIQKMHTILGHMMDPMTAMWKTNCLLALQAGVATLAAKAVASQLLCNCGRLLVCTHEQQPSYAHISPPHSCGPARTMGLVCEASVSD